MEPVPEFQGTRRLRWLIRGAVLWAVVIFARLVDLQVIHHEQYRRQALRQSWDEIKVPAPRGRIVDRSGETLAISIPTETVAVNPRRTPDLSVAADIFSRVFRLDRERLLERLESAAAEGRGYVPIRRRISREEAKKIRGMNLDWVDVHPDSLRRYPNGTLAANLLGSVDWWGEGNAGLELSWNSRLRGKPGKLRIMRDARGKTIESEVLTAPEPGADIGLSIDERIQYFADRALHRAARQWRATAGSLVVMEPKTGEILAMSSYPTFDPNRRARRTSELRLRINQAITVPFEPGSVFKIVTLSAGLEAAGLTPSTLIDCGNGVIRLFRRRIHDIHAYGTIPLEKVLWKSSNIGAIQVALRVGERRLLDYVRRFGFGRKTGIPLPGESAGLVRDLGKWRRTSIASVAMGHEISVTTLQLALATSVIASGGLLPKPRLVLWTQRAGGEKKALDAPPPERVLKPETAITMRRMMEGVVLEGTGTKARLAGYSAGGKTGSAQIFDFETGRYSHRYNASFVGFAPVQDPAVVVVVTLNGVERYGGVVAAPVFREVAQAALRILGVVPDVVKPGPPPAEGEEVYEDLAIAGLGEAPERPSRSGPPVREAAVEEASLAASPYVFGPRAPNLYGKTLRRVLEETSRAGLRVEYSGSGVVRAQYPPPGAVLPAGEPLIVELAW